MSDKTLVERLRDIVDESNKRSIDSISKYVYPVKTSAAEAILGRQCLSRQDECELFMAIADAIEWEYMPRPRFSNNEPMHFGDWFTAEKYGVKEPEQLKRLCIFSPELLKEWGQDDGEKFAFELNYTRPADLDFRFEKCEKPEPEVLDTDGIPIHVGDHVWFKQGTHYDGVEYVVTEVTKTQVHYKNSEGEYPRGGCPHYCASNNLTHKQPDSLERIEEDAKLDVCVYFGHDQQSCEGCPVRRNQDECEAQKALDLLSRQRKVLERGR